MIPKSMKMSLVYRQTLASERIYPILGVLALRSSNKQGIEA